MQNKLNEKNVKKSYKQDTKLKEYKVLTKKCKRIATGLLAKNAPKSIKEAINKRIEEICSSLIYKEVQND